MKILKKCWDQVHAFDCQYGSHLFDKDVASIYVSHWLSVSAELFHFFTQK